MLKPDCSPSLRKRGIELAVNFLVVFILMIVVLGLGLTLFFKLKAGTEQINQDVSEETRRQIEEVMITSGSKVMIPFVIEDIQRGKSGYFLIGIENILDQPAEFKIKVTAGQADADQPHYIEADNAVTISPHERVYRKLWFNVPKAAASKQFIYNVRVCRAESGMTDTECPADMVTYPPLQKVYVKPK
jgi:hypothetical protein